jgi:hypothetical protein
MPAYSYKTVQNFVLFEVQRQLARAADPTVQNVLAIPLILGGVGVGKTALDAAVAERLGIPLLTINCGEAGDATDLTGVPMPTEVKKDKSGRTHVSWTMPLDIYRAVTEPCVLFFDDVDKLPLLVEGALIGLFGKRSVKGHQLHQGTVLMAAGNRATDDRLARDLSESLRTRATVIELEYTFSDLRRYAEEHPGEVDPLVLGFLAYAPQHLHAPTEASARFPTPRGWVEFSDAMRSMQEGLDRKERPFLDLAKATASWQKFLLTHKCGEGVANDFWAWYSILRMIDVKLLLTEGKLRSADNTPEAAAPWQMSEAGLRDFAAVAAIAAQWNKKGGVKDTHAKVLLYLDTLVPELRVALYAQLTLSARKAIASSAALVRVSDALLRDLARAEGDLP